MEKSQRGSEKERKIKRQWKKSDNKNFKKIEIEKQNSKRNRDKIWERWERRKSKREW